MKRSGTKRSFFAMTVLAVLLAVAMPATSFGKDHDRHGRGRRGKCGKFVNCHDARDGRRDGRGPRADRVSNFVLRNRLRNRNRRFDDDFRFRTLRRQRIRSFNNNRWHRDRN
jgi:hypothetical protein